MIMSDDKEFEKIRQKKRDELLRKDKVTSKTGDVVVLTGSTFDSTVKGASLPVLVDFWADWCMPCRMMVPVIEELACEYVGKAVFAKINVDENPEIAERFNVVNIPFFVIFKNGQPIEQIIGAVGRKPLEEAIKKHMKP